MFLCHFVITRPPKDRIVHSVKTVFRSREFHSTMVIEASYQLGFSGQSCLHEAPYDFLNTAAIMGFITLHT